MPSLAALSLPDPLLPRSLAGDERPRLLLMRSDAGVAGLDALRGKRLAVPYYEQTPDHPDRFAALHAYQSALARAGIAQSEIELVHVRIRARAQRHADAMNTLLGALHWNVVDVVYVDTDERLALASNAGTSVLFDLGDDL